MTFIRTETFSITGLCLDWKSTMSHFPNFRQWHMRSSHVTKNMTANESETLDRFQYTMLTDLKFILKLVVWGNSEQLAWRINKKKTHYLRRFYPTWNLAAILRIPIMDAVLYHVSKKRTPINLNCPPDQIPFLTPNPRTTDFGFGVQIGFSDVIDDLGSILGWERFCVSINQMVRKRVHMHSSFTLIWV